MATTAVDRNDEAGVRGNGAGVRGNEACVRGNGAGTRRRHREAGTVTPVTRRRVLAGVGSLGFAAAAAGGGLPARPGRSPPYTRYTFAATGDDTDDGRLRVAWYERYNGALVETQGDTTGANASTVLDPATPPTYVAEAPGPVVTVGNVLPGDSGLLAVGLLAERVEGATDVDVWLRASLDGNCENRVTEPESKDPAETDPLGPPSCPDEPGLGTGELAGAVRAAAWLDAGLAGVGACDGALGPGETPLASGSLGDVLRAPALADGTRLAACLAPGDHRCLGLSWDLPADAGNDVQGDSLSFSLEFAGVPCDSTNPFDGGETA